MSQTQESEQKQNQQNHQPPVARAEETLNQAGRTIGLFAGMAGLNIRQAAATLRKEWQRAARPNMAPGEKAEQPEIERAEAEARLAGEKTTEQAEQMVDQAAQRLGQLSATLSHQVQKAAARMREEGEDIWFEAHHLRQKNTPPNTQQK